MSARTALEATAVREKEFSDLARVRRSQAAHIAVVTRLLDAGMDVNAMHCPTVDAPHRLEPTSMLHIACERSYVALARFLVARGADVNLATPVRGYTPVFLAIELHGQASRMRINRVASLVQLLRRHGADFGHLDANGHNVLQKWAVAAPDPFISKTRHGVPPVDERAIVDNLKPSEADCAATDAGGNTALMLAAGCADSKLHSIIQYMRFEANTPVGPKELDRQNTKGDTCLHMLVRDKGGLFEHENDSDGYVSQDDEALHQLDPPTRSRQVWIARCRAHCIERVIDSGANMHLRNNDGETAADILSRYDARKLRIVNYPVVSQHRLKLLWLIPTGTVEEIADAAGHVADLNAQNFFHPSALHVAVRHNRLDVVALLLALGVDVLQRLAETTRASRVRIPHDILDMALGLGEHASAIDSDSDSADSGSDEHSDGGSDSGVDTPPPSDGGSDSGFDGVDAPSDSGSDPGFDCVDAPSDSGAGPSANTQMQLLLIQHVFGARASERAPERAPDPSSVFRSTMQLYLFRAVDAVCSPAVVLELLRISARERVDGESMCDRDGLGPVQRAATNIRHCQCQYRLMGKARLLAAIVASRDSEQLLWDRSTAHTCSGARCSCCKGMCDAYRQQSEEHCQWKNGSYTLLGTILHRSVPTGYAWTPGVTWTPVPPHLTFLKNVVAPRAWRTMMQSRRLAFLMCLHPRLGRHPGCDAGLLDEFVLHQIFDAFEDGFSPLEKHEILTTTNSLTGV